MCISFNKKMLCDNLKYLFIFYYVDFVLKSKVFRNSSKRQLARIFFINSGRKDSIYLRYAHERGKGVRQLNAAIFVVCKRSVDFRKKQLCDVVRTTIPRYYTSSASSTA